MGSGPQGAGVTLEKRSISGPRCPPTASHPSEPLLSPLPRMPSLPYPTPQGSDVFTLLSSRQENRPAHGARPQCTPLCVVLITPSGTDLYGKMPTSLIGATQRKTGGGASASIRSAGAPQQVDLTSSKGNLVIAMDI